MISPWAGGLPRLCLPSVSPVGPCGVVTGHVASGAAVFPEAPVTLTRKPPSAPGAGGQISAISQVPFPARDSTGIRGQGQGSTAFTSAPFRPRADSFSLPPQISWTKTQWRDPAEGQPSIPGKVLEGPLPAQLPLTTQPPFSPQMNIEQSRHVCPCYR